LIDLGAQAELVGDLCDRRAAQHVVGADENRAFRGHAGTVTTDRRRADRVDRHERRCPMTDTNEFADRYMSLWNEPNPERRRQLVAELWTEDGAQILQPPQEIREIAARPGIGMSATLETRGHAALEDRATSVYDEWVDRGGFHFLRRDNVDRIADVVKFNWEMLSADGEVAGVGLAFLVLAPNGRIRLDYQFIES
jgi:hypothetical protein